eukprot:s522_g23.t1
MREKVFAATLALKLVDHSLRHCPENCQIFVEKLGLKVLFAIFMKKGRGGCWSVILSIWLEGCDDEPQTCYPDGSASETGEYSCVSNRYCSRQDFATVLPNAMSLQECMDECKSRNCADCGTHCWLLDNCGDYVTSSCTSSIYFRDLNFVASTTSTTTTASFELGSCFPNTVDSGQYSCTATRYCSNQENGVNTGTKTLQSCIDECNADSSCVSIQYDCSTDCVLFTGGQTCGTELSTVCGSSLYYKQTGAVSTTGPDVAGGCFPSTFDTGSYTCSAEALKAKIGAVFLLKGYWGRYPCGFS